MAKFSINTGEPRHVFGHFVSGAVACGIASATLNYKDYKNKELSTKQILVSTLKTSVEGGAVTASAIAAANYLGKGNILGLLGSVSLGLASVYAIEQISQKYPCKKEDEFLIKKEGK